MKKLATPKNRLKIFLRQKAPRRKKAGGWAQAWFFLVLKHVRQFRNTIWRIEKNSEKETVTKRSCKKSTQKIAIFCPKTRKIAFISIKLHFTQYIEYYYSVL